MDNYSRALKHYDDPNQFSDDDENEDDTGFSFNNTVVDELRIDLKKSLKIDNSCTKKRSLAWAEEEEEEYDNDDVRAALLVRMGYGKTGPPIHEPPANPLPADNLKSAMKESGKKEGLVDEERKVSWAPDVYDPPPTSESHYALNRTERHKNESKKPGKNRQKRGGKGVGEGLLGGVGGAKGGKDKAKKKGGGGTGGGAGGAKGGKDKDKKQVKKCGGREVGASKYAEYDAFY